MKVPPLITMLSITCALAVGFASGLWYRDHLPLHTRDDLAPSTKSAWGQPTPPPLETAVPMAETRPPASAPGAVGLEGLLAGQRFAEATDLYYEALQSGASDAPQMRATIASFMRQCLKTCADGGFLSFIDAWLATFYDDVPALLLFAEYQEHQGQPEAAANTLLLARTYALAPGDQASITQALMALAARTDKRLSDAQRWTELLGFYEFLAAIDFSNRELRLRRALLYMRLGESGRGERLLASLLDADDGLDPQWTQQLQQQLAAVTGERSVGPAVKADPAPRPAFANTLPLERRGDGYVAEAILNDRSRIRLLVDTGATITTLSRDSFRRLHRADFSFHGVQLFNTANGYTRGEIYRAMAITLGAMRLQNIHVAVMDFSGTDGIDGLLGMNVLREFRFEIDQRNAEMHLGWRQGTE